jgi:hypothetical protein
MADVKKELEPTKEVGSEGGGTGELETGREAEPGKGSESTETWRSASKPRREKRPEP